MPTIKTAISIDKSLYKKIEKLSHELDMPKSRIFSQAVEYIVEKKDNLELLKKINAAYPDKMDNPNSEYLKAAKKTYSTIVDKW
jgi:hypothetical protein